MTVDRQAAIAEAKARYEALFAKGKIRPNPDSAPGNPAVLEPRLVLRRQTLPGGWGLDLRLYRGDAVRLSVPTSTQGVSVLLYNAADPTERFNAGDTVKIQWSAKLDKGRLLFSDMGRVLASITDDTFGWNDALAGCSSKFTNAERYGDGTLRSSRENFILLAAKHGLSKADIAPCITFFAPVGVDATGRVQWNPPGAKPGDYIDLRAEMNLLVFVSNCPHPLSPGGYAPEDIEIVTWNAETRLSGDYCRTATDEGRRGFENTDALFK